MPLPYRPTPVDRRDPPLAKLAMGLFMTLICALIILAIAGAAWLVAVVITNFPH